GVYAEPVQAGSVELGFHGGRRVVVGELQLDRPKTGRGRSRETLDQRALGEKISEIGGEARHEGRPLGRDLIAMAIGTDPAAVIPRHAPAIHPSSYKPFAP